jgi:hypothetical protein
MPSLLSLALVVVLTPYPLLATPSPESANALGLFLGPFGAWCAAMWVQHRKDAKTRACLENAISLFLGFFIFVTFSFLRAFSEQNCSPSQTLATYFAMSFPVIFLDMTVGFLIGQFARSKTVASLALLFFFLTVLGLETWWWWHNPGLRSANHFFFVIAGDIIEGDTVNTSLIYYRLSTLFWALGLFLLSFVFASKTKPFAERRRENVHWLALSSLSLGLLSCAFLLNQSAFPQLIISREKLLNDYSLQRRMGSIVVQAHPSHTSPDDIDKILAESKLWLSRLKQRTGLTLNGNVRIFLHKDADSIAYYTGAKHVHFALPRHREFHISGTTVPHPSLGHELAHVLIGQVTNTIWGTPGRFWILPNFALTEGLAVAVSSELNISAELTLEEQAAAIYQASLAPNLRHLLSATPAGFFLQQQALAYVLTGAFVEWYLRQEPGGLANLSFAGTLTKAIGAEKEGRLINRFTEHMLGMPLPDFAIPWAKEHFSAKSIVLAECPATATSREMRLEALALQKDFASAQKLMKASSPAESTAAFSSFANKALENQNFGLAAQAFEAALTNSKNETRDHIKLAEKLGDAHFLNGSLAQALIQWDAIDVHILPPSEQRSIIARRHLAKAALGNGKLKFPAIAALYLLADPRLLMSARYAELATLTERYGQQDSQRDTLALVRYLLLRNLALRQSPPANEGLEELFAKLSVEHHLLPKEFQIELLWMRLKYHMGLGRFAYAKEDLRELASIADLAGIKQRITDYKERIHFLEHSTL